jgi:hypothetical protein
MNDFYFQRDTLRIQEGRRKKVCTRKDTGIKEEQTIAGEVEGMQGSGDCAKIPETEKASRVCLV